MSRKKYLYFPVVRYRYKNKGRFSEKQDDFNNLDDCLLFFRLYLRNGCWFRVPVLDVTVDRDRHCGSWVYCRNKSKILPLLPQYLRDVRLTAIRNARKGIEFPY